MPWTLLSLLLLIAGFQTAAGSITGRVLDESNRPVGGIAVQLLYKGYDAEGISGMRVVRTAVTNAQGECTFPQIPPSRYYLKTAGAKLASDGKAYAAVYYAGTAEETTAIPLHTP